MPGFGVASVRLNFVVSPGRRKIDWPGVVRAVGWDVLAFLALFGDFPFDVSEFGASMS